MQLFTLKFGRDTDNSMSILVEQQLKGISIDPKLQNLRFLSPPLGSTSIPMLTAISGTAPRTRSGIWNSVSLLWAVSPMWMEHCLLQHSQQGERVECPVFSICLCLMARNTESCQHYSRVLLYIVCFHYLVISQNEPGVAWLHPALCPVPDSLGEDDQTEESNYGKIFHKWCFPMTGFELRFSTWLLLFVVLPYHRLRVLHYYSK